MFSIKIAGRAFITLFSYHLCSTYSIILYMVMLFKLPFSSYVGSVVPINATVRLPGKNWTSDLLNTTSDAFSNLSKELQIKVSIRHLYYYITSKHLLVNYMVG